MSDYGTIIAPGTIRFERLLPGPVERVWAYLTESEKRGKWLATGPMELHEGGRIELHFKHADLSPQAEPIPEKFRQFEKGARVAGRITRCEPPRLLSHTWDEDPEVASEVTFELTPRGDDVLLVLTHRRLDAKTMRHVAGGWHTHLGILLDNLNGRVPKPFWGRFTLLEREYERRLAAA